LTPYKGYFQLVIGDGLNPESLTMEGQLEPYLRQLNALFKTHPLLKDKEGSSGGGYLLLPDLMVLRNARVRAGYRIGEMLFGGAGTHYDKEGIVESELSPSGQSSSHSSTISGVMNRPPSPERPAATTSNSVYPSPSMDPVLATESDPCLFEDDQLCGVIHLIGERPGNGQATYSAYIAVATRRDWNIRDDSSASSLSPTEETTDLAQSTSSQSSLHTHRRMNHDQTLVVSGISQFALDPERAANATVELMMGKVAGFVRGAGNIPPPNPSKKSDS
jgi:hypothetical protein